MEGMWHRLTMTEKAVLVRTAAGLVQDMKTRWSLRRLAQTDKQISRIEAAGKLRGRVEAQTAHILATVRRVESVAELEEMEANLAIGLGLSPWTPCQGTSSTLVVDCCDYAFAEAAVLAPVRSAAEDKARAPGASAPCRAATRGGGARGGGFGGTPLLRRRRKFLVAT
eukprot:scaffold1462_cov260-Pinguiococcus_pyrenoidosus.AAC.17